MEQKIDEILKIFRQNGGRITSQRRILIELIIKNPNCTCKELYYLARKNNAKIGRATIYRTINSLKFLKNHEF